MGWFFDITSVLFEVQGYSVSPLEAFSVLTAFISVWLAAKNNIHTWTVGLVSVVTFFCLFYQANLYSDMLLQVFFFVTNILGIVWWKRPVLEITKVGHGQAIMYVLAGLSFSMALGVIMTGVHVILPGLFSNPADYPFMDAFTTVFSVIATILLIQRRIECWWFWISVDIVATIIYYQKGLYVASLEYLVFLGMATYGLYCWYHEITLGNIRTHSE